jgi:signal peptidase I
MDFGKNIHLKWKPFLKTVFFWFMVVIIGLLLALALQLFVFSSFNIPSSSMKPTIIPGDKVIVIKLIPGPRIIHNFFSLHKGEKPNITRLKGIRSIRRNDVLIFNFPYSDRNRLDMDMNVFYAKRCVAIPGDTFYIENGIYKVRNISDILGNYDIQENFSHIKEENIPADVFRCFPKRSKFNKHLHWTLHNFGPLYIPGKNDCISMDTSNIALYENLIAYETGKHISVIQGHVFLDDSLITAYSFRKNYYFMAGDYTPDSHDSRYWGLLPEDHIVGKVAFVWQSKDRQTGKRRWERFFKTVN